MRTVQQSHPPGVFKRKRTLKDQDHETVDSCFVKIVMYYRAEEGMTGTGSLLGRIPKGGRCLSWVLIDECKILSVQAQCRPGLGGGLRWIK